MTWPAGAWQRVSVTVPPAGPTEVSDVWWLVSDDHFADFRVLREAAGCDLPYSATQAFAGTFTYEPATGTMRWTHLADTLRRESTVTGEVRPDAADSRLMHERGDGFTELWARMDPAGSGHQAVVGPAWLLVRVGPYAVAVGTDGRSAARYQQGLAGWLALDGIGDLPLTVDEVAALLPR